MNRQSQIALLVALGACAVVFTYLSILTISALEPASPTLVWIVVVSTLISTWLFQLLVLVWTIAVVFDRLHYYKVQQKHREMELQVHRRRTQRPSRW